MPDEASSVEFATRDFLTQPEAPVHYVENALINSLFGLLCWEVIFLPLPGAFFHEFHAAPADIYSPDFFRRREREFAARFAQLHTGEYRDTIFDTFARKAGIQSAFVSWGWITEELLTAAVDCLPPEHLEHCFRRIVRDVKTNRAGFPDLIQFWPRERRYRMIEVKGPGDRLQDNQIRWLGLLRLSRHAGVGVSRALGGTARIERAGRPMRSPSARCASSRRSRAIWTCASRRRQRRWKAWRVTPPSRRAAMATTTKPKSALTGEYGALRVGGRADGYDPAKPISSKSSRPTAAISSGMPANHRHLHWAQVKIYGWLMCQLPASSTDIKLALVYFDVVSQRETVLVEQHSAPALREFFEQQCDRFLRMGGEGAGSPRSA